MWKLCTWWKYLDRQSRYWPGCSLRIPRIWNYFQNFFRSIFFRIFFLHVLLIKQCNFGYQNMLSLYNCYQVVYFVWIVLTFIRCIPVGSVIIVGTMLFWPIFHGSLTDCQSCLTMPCLTLGFSSEIYCWIWPVLYMFCTNTYAATLFSCKMLSTLWSAAYTCIQMHLRMLLPWKQTLWTLIRLLPYQTAP